MSTVGLTQSGPPETVLQPYADEALSALTKALKIVDVAERRASVADVVAAWPTFLDGWAQLGLLGRDTIESYAAYRVGYHRGLDALRRGGWRGSGYVRWVHETNRGFLRCLRGLEVTAALISENDESERCATFLKQLDPAWEPELWPS